MGKEPHRYKVVEIKLIHRDFVYPKYAEAIKTEFAYMIKCVETIEEIAKKKRNFGMVSRGTMTDGQQSPEEFPKKQKEDRICPDATTCENLYTCFHAKPHKSTTGYHCRKGKKCIKIPDMWLDKGGKDNAEIKN